MKKRLFDNSWLSIREQILAYIHKQMIHSKKDAPIILPPDIELAKQFKCSLSPVKKAMNDLKLKGIVQRKQGCRTVAIRSTVTVSETPSLTGLSDKAKTLGAEVKNNVMYWGIAEQVPKPNDITFKFDHDKKVYRLKRLRFFDSQPRVIQDTYFCDFANVFPSNVITYHNFSEASLFAFYKSYGYHIVNRITMLQAVNLDINAASLLNVDETEPVLQSRQVTYARHDDSDDEFVLEYMIAVYTKWKYLVNRRE